MKLDKNVVVFKLVGTTNMLSVKDTIRNTQKEIHRSQQDSWHSIWLRIYLAELFSQLEAVSSALIEIDAVLATLDNDKYKLLPYGYYLMATALAEKVHIMNKQRTRHTSEIQVVINKMEVFLKDTDFTRSGLFTTQMLHGKVIADPSCMQEYIDYAVQVGKNIIQHKILSFISTV